MDIETSLAPVPQSLGIPLLTWKRSLRKPGGIPRFTTYAWNHEIVHQSFLWKRTEGIRVICKKRRTKLRLCLHFVLYQVPGLIGKTKATRLWPCGLLFLVEISGIEPLTSCMPCRRSPKVSGVHHHKTQPAYVDIYSAAESLLKL